jgi:hypothetical protein
MLLLSNHSDIQAKEIYNEEMNMYPFNSPVNIPSLSLAINKKNSESSGKVECVFYLVMLPALRFSELYQLSTKVIRIDTFRS